MSDVGSTAIRQTHLEYYTEHGIAPVRYDLSSIDAHLERRESLYNMLGMPPLAFRGADILEVAAGTGQNSLYLASRMPSSLMLLEPNTPGIALIQKTYAEFARPHVAPTILNMKLEEYESDERFDVILCENWLGTSAHEIALLKKLAGLVAPLGVLIITVVSPIGFVPNLLRRFFVPYLAPVGLGFGARTKLLEEAYGPHLKTLPAMTRSATDWVHDNMLNPAYFGLCLSMPLLVSLLGKDFGIMRSSPSFEEDWRWFKGLYGAFRKRNEHFLQEYRGKCHNYLDCNAATFPSEAVRNEALEGCALLLLKAVEAHEDAHLQGGDAAAAAVAAELERFLGLVPVELGKAQAGLSQVLRFIREPAACTPSVMAGLDHFGSLFGRETSYLSLMKR